MRLQYKDRTVVSIELGNEDSLSYWLVSSHYSLTLCLTGARRLTFLSLSGLLVRVVGLAGVPRVSPAAIVCQVVLVPVFHIYYVCMYAYVCVFVCVCVCLFLCVCIAFNVLIKSSIW